MTETHVGENLRYWDAMADQWAEAGELQWASEPNWGQWGIPEAELALFPPLDGVDAIELGCGTGYVSAWMWRRGARVVAVDVSGQQLATARRLAVRHQVPISFVQADAEAVPLRDDSFDFAVSEFGAALWCEPRAWLAEARRLLRPGGRLVFLSSTPLATLCMPTSGAAPAGRELVRDYFGLYRVDWSDVEIDPGGVEFVPTLTDWFRIFREVGLVVDDYMELQAPEESSGMPFTVTAEWARRWPSEHVWKLVG